MNRLINASKLIDFANNQKDKRIDANDIARFPAAQALPIPDTGVGDVSNGYHTFNELYHHRAILFATICNMHPYLCWKSTKHFEGDMFDGMFIVGINTPKGPATYHYDIDPYWDMFDVTVLDNAPKWDGHTPDDALDRIKSLCIDDSPAQCDKGDDIKSKLISAFSSCRYGTDDYLAEGILSKGIYLPKDKFDDLLRKMENYVNILDRHSTTHEKVSAMTNGQYTEMQIISELVDMVSEIINAGRIPNELNKVMYKTW